MEKITRTNVIRLWANKFPEVQRWLTKLQRKDASAYYFYRFCQWAQKTPSELLALKEKDAQISPAPNTVEKLLDEFCGLTELKSAEKFNVSVAVKSFFKWNYRDLARASGIVSLEKVKPYNPLSKESLRKLYNRALNPRDRALIPFVTCTGIAKETLTNLLWAHLEPDWETKEIPCITIGSELLKGHGKGKYKGIKQITFLTPEAKRELINYRDWIQDKLGRKLQLKDHIWLESSKPYSPLAYGALGEHIGALSKDSQVPFSLHDGRRWINTGLESIGISSNWARKIRGRKVKGEESPYSQPQIEQLREKFREAIPALEFISAIPSALEDRLKTLEKFKESLTPEQQELVKRSGLKFSKRKRKPKTECLDGEHCQKVVGEAELPDLLAAGWHASIVLPSGNIIMER